MFTKQNKAGKTGEKRTKLKKQNKTDKPEEKKRTQFFKTKQTKLACVCARACARMCGARRSGVTGEWWSGGGGLSPA